MNAPTAWPSEAVWEQIFPLLPHFTVEVLPEIDSSNSELMRRARAGQTEPTLLVAERQTAGRGRMGRVWQSQAGDSLTFSLSLPLSPRNWSGLSLAVGLSLAESLHPQIGLKWPNDLWWEDRKLGGILIEAASMGEQSQVVVGVGLNIRPRPAEGLNTPPAALTELRPELSAASCLAAVALPLVQTLLAFERQGFAPLQKRFSERDVLKGRHVHTSDGREGWAAGVGENGEFQLQTEAGLQAINSAEVSVRPFPAADQLEDRIQ
jgi:BirA family biotin operon repressor/biotin-[acetyl-CoA-carboxylase] ligase